PTSNNGCTGGAYFPHQSAPKFCIGPKVFTEQSEMECGETLGLAPQAMSPHEDHRMAWKPKNIQGGNGYVTYH
ncbi:MAG: hypothetical protein Q8S17_02530, partial [Humidesulfovibrio sp.]|nr:hypothetical protein [Humidesulfovibrio sp.]